MGKACNATTSCNEEKLLFIEKNGYSIMDCKKCGHRFLDIQNAQSHLKKVYSDDYFFAGKAAGYPNYLEQKNILLKYGTKYARIIAKHMKPGKVLDTGCAAGFILKSFEKAGWDCHGVEPNDTMASYGRKELSLSINTGSFEEFKSPQKFDLVNMIQVIGHFYDIDKAMLNLNTLLNSDGLVLVESWNRESAIAKLLGRNWAEYSPPSVVNWFSGETLNQLFAYYGFELIDHGLPAKQINIKHAVSLLDEKMPYFWFKDKFVKLVNRSIGRVILPYPLLDLNWYIFRKKAQGYIN